MADERNIGVRVTATDDTSGGTLSAAASLQKLQQMAAKLGLEWDNLTLKTQKSLAAQLGIKVNIEEATKALQAQAAQLAAMRNAKLDYALGPDYTRQIQSASEAAGAFKTSLAAAAEADSDFRNASISAAAAAKEQKQYMAALEAETNGAAAAQARLNREMAESAVMATIATTYQWEQALKTTGQSAEETRRKLEQMYNVGSVQRRTLSEGIDASMEGKHANMSESDLIGGGRGGGTQRAGSQFANSNISAEMRHSVGIFDSLARGNTGQAISSIGAALRDAGLSTTALLTSFGALVTLMATGAVMHEAEALGKWAENMRAGASATGMSLQQFSATQGAMVLLGEKADSADASLRHFAETLSTAMADPASKAAEAFRTLGITQDDLHKSGGDVSSMLDMVANRWTLYGNSAQKANAGQELFGRGLEKIGPLLGKGADGLSKLKDQAEAAGLTLNDTTAAALADTGERMDTFSARSQGSAKKAFEAWAPEINGVIDLLTSFVTKLGETGKAAGDFYNNLPDWFKTAQKYGAKSALDLNPKTKIMDLGRAFGVVAPEQEQTATDPKNPSGLQALTAPLTAGGTSKQIGGVDVTGGALGSKGADVRSALEEYRHNVEDAKEAIREQAQAVRAATQANQDHVRAIKDAIRMEMDQAKIDLDGIEQQQKEKINNIKSGAQTTNQVAGAQQATAGFANIATGKNNTATDNEAASNAIAENAKKEIASLEEVANDANNSAEVRKAAAEEVLRTVTETENKMAELYRSSGNAAKTSANLFLGAWQMAFDHLDSEMDQFAASVTKALIAPKQELIKAGLTTIKINLAGNEIKTAAQQLALSFSSELTKGLTQGLSSLAAGGIAKMLGISLAPGAGIGGLISSAIGGGGGAGQAAQFGITASNLAAFNAALVSSTATLAGHAAVTTGSAAANTANTVATTTNTVATAGNTTAEAGSSGGGIMSWLGGIGSIFGFEGGGVVTSAAGGMLTGGAGGRGIDGRGGMMSILHPKEMVLDRGLSQGIQNMVSRGGDTNSTSISNSLNFSPIVNGRGRGGDPMSDLRSLSGSMMGEARNMVRRGARF